MGAAEAGAVVAGGGAVGAASCANADVTERRDTPERRRGSVLRREREENFNIGHCYSTAASGSPFRCEGQSLVELTEPCSVKRTRLTVTSDVFLTHRRNSIENPW
jgi:hypothetical protein